MRWKPGLRCACRVPSGAKPGFCPLCRLTLRPKLAAWANARGIHRRVRNKVFFEDLNFCRGEPKRYYRDFGTPNTLFRNLHDFRNLPSTFQGGRNRPVGNPSILMKTRKIPTSIPALIAFALQALAGARARGAAVALAQNTAARIEADIVDYTGDPGPDPVNRGREAAWQLTREELSIARKALRVAKSEARKFWSDAVDLLKIHLGRTWNARWEAAGFTRYTLSTSRGEPLPMLLRVRSYFRDHAVRENAPLNITAAEADLRIAAIEQAQKDVGAALAASKQAAADRRNSVKRLRRRLTGLRQELEQLLEPGDVRWYEFGFSRRGDPRRPQPVRDLVVTPGQPGELLVQHAGSPRAVDYRVSWKVAESDGAWEEVGRFADATVLLRGLPSGAEVIVGVTARNEGGETPPSKVRMVVP